MYEDELSQYIQNVLQREPDPGEVESYQSIIDNNVASLDEVLGMIINSSEAVDNVYPVILAYQAIYGRVPDAGGLEYWTGVYESNHGLDNPDTTTVDEALVAVLKAFVNPAQTPEFVSRYGANPSGDQFVAAAYQNVLNRAPDQAGLTYWQARYAQIHDQLEAKAEADAAAGHPALTAAQIDVETRAQILEQFVDSAEYKTSTAEEVDAFLAARAHGEDTSGSLWEFDPNAHVGQTFTLTENSDTLQGLPGNLIGSEGTVDNSQDDTIIAGTSVAGGIAQNNLGSGDVIDGGTGHDVLRIIDDAGAALTPNMTNVEVIEAQALAFGGLEINMINTTGVQEVVNGRSTSNVTFNDIQSAAAIGVTGTSSTTFANFHAGADFGGDMHINVDGAGVSGDRADIFVSTDDTPAALSIDSSGDASFVRVDVDNNPGFGGTTVAFETLNITGDADLNVRDNGGEFDHVMAVNVDFTGSLNLDFSNNDEDVSYNGANGSGNDVLDFSGNGNNTIDTGAGDDRVDVSGSGDNSVMLGDGDDFVDFGSNATAADTADGGAGTDTIAIDVDILDANAPGGLTADGIFANSISNFEKVYITDDVDSGEIRTVDMANLDNIDYIITDGTDATNNPSQPEIQFVDFNNADVSGGSIFVTVAGHDPIKVDIAAGASATNVATAVRDAIAAQNYPEISDVSVTNNGPGGFDNVQITFTPDGPVTDGALTFTNNATNIVSSWSTVTPQTNAALETFTVHIDAGTGVTPANWDLFADGINTALSVTENSTIDEIGAQIVAYEQNPAALYNVTYDASSDNLTFVAKAPGNLSDVTELVDPQNLTTVGAISQGATGTPEVQRLTITGGAPTPQDGRIIVEGVVIDVPAGSTANDIAALIVNHASEIETAIEANHPNVLVTSISNTLNTVDVTFDPLGSNPVNGIVSVIGDNNPGVSSGGGFTLQQGDVGDPDGTLVLQHVQTGATLELAGSNAGSTEVHLATDSASDSLTIVLDDGIGDNNGLIHVAGIETLNVNQMADSATNLGLDAPDTTTVTVTGVGGVNFIDDFAKLTSFDASGVTGTGADGAVTVVTNADADTSLTGGAGDDHLTGSNAAAHVDTINGGVGDDHIIGRAGADVLTGGAGHDTFVYQVVADSQGTTVDTIADFVSGEDKLDLSAVTAGAGEYTGAADGYGAVLTSLTHTNGQAVLDSATSTLYVDVDGSGTLDSHDMAIHLTGVTSLDNATDFTW
jgi:S-layer protein